jgi:DNA-directed RNA polymerase specialized sigma24 family protein
LEGLTAEQAALLGLPWQDVEDAFQDTCEKITEIGTPRLPPDLVGSGRRPWLRRVARNAVLRRLKANLRWHRFREPRVVENRNAALCWPRHHAERPATLDLGGLPEGEAEVLALAHLGLTHVEIAALSGLALAEVLRRARWGELRRIEGPGRVPPHLGLEPGSLAALRGIERWRWVSLLDRHGWPDGPIASELGLSEPGLRMLRYRNRANGAERAGEL